MAQTMWCWPKRKRLRGWRVVAAWLLLCGISGSSRADEPAAVSVSATVDKTEVAIGEQVTLTVTLSGDLSGAQLDATHYFHSSYITRVFR